MSDVMLVSAAVLMAAAILVAMLLPAQEEVKQEASVKILRELRPAGQVDRFQRGIARAGANRLRTRR